MSIKKIFYVLALAAVLFSPLPTRAAPTFQLDSPDPPATPVKLIFVHHSTGGNWLADPNGDQPYGGLGMALRDNNYFVSATNYGWGPDEIGSRTDIPNWPEWFTDTVMSQVYAESDQNICNPTSPSDDCFGDWSRLGSDPGGENEIVMFKSCFPNSDLYGDPDDPPLAEPNDEFTVENAKAVYNHILTYFATRQDKLFVVITAPPLRADDTEADRAANARAFNNWLVDNWLTGYAYKNVAVFDYYNVLTSNGGDADTNDVGAVSGNHHRWWSGAVQHIQTVSSNVAAYPSGDSHPSTAGHTKATAEFVPLLNVFYNRWKSGSTAPPSLTLTSPVGGEYWAAGSRYAIRWATGGTVSSVNLSYSTDGFSTLATSIASDLANAGSYVWTTPVITTTNMQVRVESVINPTAVYDVSDPFSLFEPLNVYLPLVLKNDVSAPSGGTSVQSAVFTLAGRNEEK